MIVQKLSWAGILIKLESTVILIDPLGNVPEGQDKPLSAKVGIPLEPIMKLEKLPTPDAILITHSHPDHFDHQSILTSFSSEIPVLLPFESIEAAKKTGLKNVIGCKVGDSFVFGSLTAKAAQSADGYGTPQISWVVEGDQRKLIHFGDTLWHGYWWKIAHELGPFDSACLPVNGPRLEVNGFSVQTTIPACMTPEEAVEATKILGARKMIPIHYGTFNNPPYYIETPNLMERLQSSSKEHGVNLEILSVGDSITL